MKARKGICKIEKKDQKRKERKESPKIFQGYKPKRSPSESSSLSSSLDEEKGTREDRIRNTLKERELSKPNLRENVIDIDYIKKCLTETDNGIQFGKLMKRKGYKFTRVHKMDQRHGDEEVYDILKEFGCLPVPD
jgi:tRNA A-37 threonylcarbamoyl transferase component Bud32